jgi:hypothetical protein
MIYKLKLDLVGKVFRSLIPDAQHQEIFDNILNGRRTSMAFQKAVLKCDSLTGEDISGIVENYEEEQNTKNAESKLYAE